MATASIGVRERMAAASKRIARVKLVDRGATGVITFGGIFIILCVIFIFVFIFAEAMPLFRGAKGSYSSFFSSSAMIEAGRGRYPSLMTTSWPSLLKMSLAYSLTSGSRGLPGALLM